jgi:hypothetical protein
MARMPGSVRSLGRSGLCSDLVGAGDDVPVGQHEASRIDTIPGDAPWPFYRFREANDDGLKLIFYSLKAT